MNYENINPSASPAFNNGCAPGCTVLTCSCAANNMYWSSTTVAINGSAAWTVDFGNSAVSAALKGGATFVRAVRGGS